MEETNKHKIQNILEKDAVNKNGGMCESYEYCRYCEQPKSFNRRSDTPCANAYLEVREITNMLKNYNKNKEYVEVNDAKIRLWKEEFNKFYNDIEYLSKWYLELNQSDNFGMPKSRNVSKSYIEETLIIIENVQEKIKEFIRNEESKVSYMKQELENLNRAILSLKEEDRYILECKYDSKFKMSTDDIVNSYFKKYGKDMKIETIKKRISNIKRKIYKIIKKI